MKNIIKFLGCAALALFSFNACSPEFGNIDYSKSTADFSKYIAIGNSLTAGYADGGLYLAGQQVAYPNLMAEQMAHVGVTTFNSPFFSEDQSNGSGYIRLKSLIDGNPETETVTDKLAIRGLNANGGPLYTKYTSDIQNLGVPGMRLDFAFAPGIGSEMGNPFFERLLDDAVKNEETYFNFATSKGHTFFTFWLGNNDVLGYATNGAVTTGETNTLTTVSTFSVLYNNFIDALTVQGQKGAVANIPDVTAVPFFTTVTYDLILAAAQAANSQVQAIYIQTKSGPRAATSKDLFGLTFPTSLLGNTEASLYPYGFHPLNPIADNFVLDEAEVAEVKEHITSFNNIIKEAATAHELALVDVHGFLNRVKTGISENGVNVNSQFIRGNAFSLDGIHLTPMGNALVGNLFIQAINSKYNSVIPKIDAGIYPGVKLP